MVEENTKVFLFDFRSVKKSKKKMFQNVLTPAPDATLTAQFKILINYTSESY